MTYTIEIVNDNDFIGWDFHIGDQPLSIEAYSRCGHNHMIHDSGADVPPDIALICAVNDSDWQELIYCFGDYEELTDGKIKYESNYDDRPIYYKSLESAARGVFAREYGYRLGDLGVDTISTRNDSVYVTWRKSAFKKYTGSVDSPSMEYLQSIMDNEIYGFEISDGSGEIVESCYGFVGDPEYCEQEARDIVKRLETLHNRAAVLASA